MTMIMMLNYIYNNIKYICIDLNLYLIVQNGKCMYLI